VAERSKIKLADSSLKCLQTVVYKTVNKIDVNRNTINVTNSLITVNGKADYSLIMIP